MDKLKRSNHFGALTVWDNCFCVTTTNSGCNTTVTVVAAVWASAATYVAMCVRDPGLFITLQHVGALGLTYWAMWLQTGRNRKVLWRRWRWRWHPSNPRSPKNWRPCKCCDDATALMNWATWRGSTKRGREGLGGCGMGTPPPAHRFVIAATMTAPSDWAAGINSGGVCAAARTNVCRKKKPLRASSGSHGNY